jgi:hypothetical protein
MIEAQGLSSRVFSSGIGGVDAGMESPVLVVAASHNATRWTEGSFGCHCLYTMIAFYSKAL